jgi:hypothetical protein
MKQLIFTFFAALLCYTLFFDQSKGDEAAQKQAMETEAVSSRTSDFRHEPVAFNASDTFDAQNFFDAADLAFIYNPNYRLTRDLVLPVSYFLNTRRQ